MGCVMSSFRAVSFFTDKYLKVALRLKESLIRHDIDHVVEPVDCRGGWVENCAMKAGFILRYWRSSDKPVVWIDADAVVNEHPSIFEHINADIGVHFRNDKRHKNELLSGTLFFNKTEGAGRILEAWAEKCKATSNEWDQRILQEVLQEMENISIYKLPSSYTKIYDTMGGVAVIEHFQRSREVKRGA